MVAQLVPDTAQVDLRLVGTTGNDAEGSNPQISFFVRDELTGWGFTQLDKLAQYVADWVATGKNGGAAAKTLVSGAYRFDRAIARDLGSTSGITQTVLINVVGTISTDTVASSEAALVQFQMGTEGPPNKGHVFWPGLATTSVVTNTIETSYAAALRQAFIDFQTDLNDPLAGGAANWAHVRISRSQQLNDDVRDARAALKAAIRAARRPTGLTNVVESFTVRPLVASQRDRRPGE